MNATPDRFASMMCFFEVSLPEVERILRPASLATLTKLTGNALPEGARRGAGPKLWVATPCAESGVGGRSESQAAASALMTTRWRILTFMRRLHVAAVPGRSGEYLH